MTWLVVIYLGSLATLFITSIWTVDDFTNKVIRTFTLQNFIEIASGNDVFQVYRQNDVISVKHWQNMSGELRFSVVTKTGSVDEKSVFDNVE